MAPTPFGWLRVNDEPLAFAADASTPWPIARMMQRVNQSFHDSDAAFFYDLLHLGELVLKLSTLAVVACLDEDVERRRYSVLHEIVRADGLGTWARLMEEVSKGATSLGAVEEAADAKREIVSAHASGGDSWQARAVQYLLQASEVIDPPKGQIPARKISLLRWYEAFVQIRNATRAHGATTESKRAESAPLLASSIRLLCENFVLFRVPWVVLHRNLSGKYRVVALAGSTEDFDYLKRESDHTLANGVYLSVGGNLRVVPLVACDPDRTDFYFANGNFRDRRYELLSYVTDGRGKGDGSIYLLPASELPPSETHAGPALDVQESTFGNVPPALRDYVARPELEGPLFELLTDDRHPVITLQGTGGVGKTSLALTVLHRLLAEGPFWAIIWFSSRDIDLLASGPKNVRPSVLTLADIGKHAAECLQPAGWNGKDFKRDAFLRLAMGSDNGYGPILFVFDNFETVSNPADVYAALDTFIRLPNKILLTTRIRDFRADYPLTVGGMTRSEFDQLVDTTVARLGVERRLTAQYRNVLFEESGGHPYVAKILLGEFAAAPTAAGIRRVMASKDHVLEALFDRSFGLLSPAAQRVFLTLCGWRSVVPRLALEAALLRPSNERVEIETAIEALERTSLVESIRRDGSDEEFLQVPLAAWLFGKKRLEVSGIRNAVDADLEFLHAFGAIGSADVSKGLAPRVARLTQFIAEGAQRGSDVSEAMQVLEYVARGFAPAWLNLAELHDESGNATEAAEATRRYLQLASDDGDAWKRLYDLCERTGDFDGAASAAVRLAERQAASFEEVSWAANRVNQLLSLRQLVIDGDAKRLLVGKLRALMQARLREADSVAYSRLAWLCLNLRDEAAARKYVRAGLRIDPANDHLVRLAGKLAIAP